MHPVGTRHSALVIAFVFLIGVWFAWYFITHMMKDSETRK
ncbi:MAG: DUF3149 domain-containing protein [Granulosicoccus sp.]